MGLDQKMTLGPAGPSLQRRVFVVPQSAQVFLLLYSDEIPLGFLPLMSFESDRCIKSQKKLTDPISNSY